MYLTPRITASDSAFLSSKNTGLGNVMFQIASCYGIAKKTGRSIVWNKLVIFAELLYEKFGFKHKYTIFRKLLETANISFSEKSECNIWSYDDGLINFLKTEKLPVELFGYLECIYYFNEYKSEIVELFLPDESSISNIKVFYPILFDTDYTTVSLHFRGNEYLTHTSIGKAWDYDYYNRAVSFIKSRVNNPIFLIFSDDMNSINFGFLEGSSYIKISNKDDYIDLWCQTLCKHNIISNSTFSFWGAYLNCNLGAIILFDKNFKKPYHDLFQPI